MQMPIEINIKTLISSSQPKDKMKGWLLLDVIIGECSSIFQLLSCEDETLLVWWDTLLVLDLCLDIFNSIRRFNFKGDGLSSQGLHKKLQTSTKTEDRLQFCKKKTLFTTSKRAYTIKDIWLQTIAILWSTPWTS